MILENYDDRINYIREIARRQKLMRKIALKGKNLRTNLDENLNESEKARTNLTELYDGKQPDFYYTDERKFAKEYYGEVYRNTTKFDNDWD